MVFVLSLLWQPVPPKLSLRPRTVTFHLLPHLSPQLKTFRARFVAKRAISKTVYCMHEAKFGEILLYFFLFSTDAELLRNQLRTHMSEN